MAKAEMMARRRSNQGNDDIPSLFPQNAAEKRRANRKPSRCSADDLERHLAAKAILDAAWETMSTEIGPLEMTVTRFRLINKSAAIDLYKNGRTPEDVTKMLGLAFKDRFYPKSPLLSKLQEHWPAVRSRINEARQALGPKKLSRDQIMNLR